MTDTTAKIAAKGLNATGVTEELARKMYDSLGSKHMAIVELTVASRAEDTDGKQKVTLNILTLEPSVDGHLDDHLRELARAMYYNRQLAEGQPSLDDDIEPTVKEVLGRGQSLLEHDADGNPVLWDGDVDDLDDDEDEDGEEEPEDVGDKPHHYVDTVNAVCGRDGCGKPAFAEVHMAATDPVPA